MSWGLPRTTLLGDRSHHNWMLAPSQAERDLPMKNWKIEQQIQLLSGIFEVRTAEKAVGEFSTCSQKKKNPIFGQYIHPNYVHNPIHR